MATDIDTLTLGKKGVQTTEFWSTLLVHAVSVLAIVWTMTGHTLDTDHLTAIIPSAAIVASSLAQFGYSLSRSRTKQAVSAVQATAVATVPVVTDLSAVAATILPSDADGYTTHTCSVGSDDGGMVDAAAVLGVPASSSGQDASDTAALPANTATTGNA